MLSIGRRHKPGVWSKGAVRPIVCRHGRRGIVLSVRVNTGLVCGKKKKNQSSVVIKSRFRLTAIDFALASNDNSSCSTDRDCDSLIGLDVLANTGDVLPNKDYIIVPGGIGLGLDVGVKVLASKYCGNSLKLLDVTGKQDESYL